MQVLTEQDGVAVRQMPFDPNLFAADAAAAPVLANLSQEKWRRARDLAKELCKRDRPRYLVLLIAANEGLARELLSRGQTSEAAQVVAYLKTIAPPEVVAALQSVQVVTPVGVANGALTVSVHWTNALVLAELSEGNAPLPTDPWLAVDSLVANAVSPPASEPGTLGSRLAAELAAVQSAVEATATGQWEAAQMALRVLPRNSVFQHWRMLLKGVRLAHLGEPKAAQQCFDSLPSQSAPARAATLWRMWLGLPIPQEIKISEAKRTTALVRMTRAPEAWGPPIIKAERAWRQGAYADAYHALSESVPGFPTTDLGLPQVLTETVLNPAPAGRDLDDVFDFAEHLYFEVEDPSLPPRQKFLLAKFAAQVQSHRLELHSVDQDWRTVIRLAERKDGPHPIRDAVLWTAAGKALSRRPPPPMFAFRVSKPDLSLAQAALQQAVQLDPLNEEAQLKLLELYRATGDKRALGQHAEAIIGNLPNHKEGLREAGRLAIERKAYGKGLEFLRRVRQLDPLDKEATGQIIRALLQQAADAYKKSKPKVVDKIWTELEPLLPVNTALVQPDLLQHRWVVRVLQGLLEADAERSCEFRSQVAQLAPSLFAVQLCEQFATAFYKLTLPAQTKLAWAEVKRDATWAEVRTAIDLNNRWHKWMPEADFYSGFKLHVEPMILSNCRRPMTGDLDDFCAVLSDCFLTRESDRFARTPARLVLQTLAQGLRAKLYNASEPRLKLAWAMVRFLNHEYGERSEIERLLPKLIAKGEHSWITLAETFLDGLNPTPSLQENQGPPLPQPTEEETDADLDREFEEFGMALILEMLEATPDEFSVIIQRLRATGMPEAALKELLEKIQEIKKINSGTKKKPPRVPPGQADFGF